jgi:phosphohistidine phosphatase
MAKRLHVLGLTLDAVLSSSATRAIQTAQAFAATGQLEVIPIPALYHADADAYLEALRGLPDKVVNVAIFGHNPTMTLIAHLLRAGQVGHVPTCGLLLADCTLETWEDLGWENLQFRSFITPKDGV